MSNTLQSVGRIALTAVGYYLGGPIGGAIGSVIGGALFPGELPEAFGPRLGPDQPITSAIIGQPIPIVFGTIDVNGNVIQDLGRVEIATKQSSGKGSPSQDVTTYTYTRTYAVMLCEGPIAGVIRIWRNNKLVYDVRSEQEVENVETPDGFDFFQAFGIRKAASTGFARGFEIYLGDDTQMPDPILEAAVGVGNQPAYRGRAYIVFYDEDVTDNGGRTSSWKFEVAKEALPSQSNDVEYSVRTYQEWISGGYTPVNSLAPPGSYRYRYKHQGGAFESGDATGTGSWRTTLSEAIDDAELIHGYTTTGAPIGWHKGSSALERTTISPYENVDPGDEVSLFIHFNSAVSSYKNRIDKIGSATVCNILAAETPAVGDPYWFSGLREDGLGASGTDSVAGRYTLHDKSSGSYVPPFPSNPELDASNNCTGGAGTPAILGGDGGGTFVADILIEVQRLPSCGNNPCDGYPSLPENPDYCVIGEAVERDIASSESTDPGAYKILQSYAEASGVVTRYPLGPAVLVGSADDNEADWTAAYNAAVSAGTASAGKTFDAEGDGDPATTYPVLSDTICVRDTSIDHLDSIPVTLASIVSDVCDRVGIASADIDVSDLTETVKGYRIDRVMSARAAIQPLQSYGYFDCVDGAVLAFPTRGKASVATLDDDTLAAHEAGQQIPPLLQMTRVEDVELPRFLGIKYPMPHADYAAGIQQSERLITTAVGKSYIDIPISMDDDKAKQMTEVGLGEAWVGRESYKVSVSPRWLELEAADAITLPFDGESQRAVITSIQGGYPGPLAIEAKRDDASIYISTAAGVASGITPQQIGIAGATIFTIIDGPAFTEDEDDAGFYIGVYGTGTRWRGAALYESIDGGSEYTFIESASIPTTMGTIESALPSGPYHIWDQANTLTVNLNAGSLNSRTEAAVLAGGNAAFVGADGRWELIQFTTATLISAGVYELSGLLRGRRGTEWAIGQSVAGDTFALADTLYRLPKTSGIIGIERLYKMVTQRTLLEAAPATSFTGQGVALECYAPSITANRDASDNITFNIVRRARLGPEWVDYSDVPLNEESERYQIDVLNSGTVVRTIDATTSTPTYSAAEQTTDFGSAQSSLDVIAYQLSATVGRGYPTEATL